MQKIHPQSDIKFRIKFRDLGQDPLPIFEFRYFTTDKTKFITASYDGTRYTNCYPCEGGVLAIWKCPNMYPGVLKVMRHYAQSDERIEDQMFDFVQAFSTNIELSDGYTETDADSEIIEECMAVKGENGVSAYESAKKGGYTKLETEFYDDLAKIESLPTKAYVDTKVAKESGKSLVSDAEKAAWNAKISQVDIDGLKIGVRNYISKQYVMDWNIVNPDTVICATDEDGDYFAVSHNPLYRDIAGAELQKDIFGGKIKYKLSTQYTFSVEWKIAGAMNVSGLIFILFYTDGTKQHVSLDGSQTTITTQSVVSQKRKTLDKISATFGTATFRTLIYNIQLTEGSNVSNWVTANEDTRLDFSQATERALIGQRWLARDRATVKQVYVKTIQGTTAAVNVPTSLNTTVDSLFMVTGLVFDTPYGTPNDGAWVVRPNTNGVLQLTVKEDTLAAKPFIVTVKYTK